MIAMHTGYSGIADGVGRNSTQYDAKRLTIGRPIPNIAGNTPAMPMTLVSYQVMHKLAGFFMLVRQPRKHRGRRHDSL